MDVIANFILGSADSPVEMAVYFMLFLILIDALFSIVTNLLNGVGR